jgi:hypothetical protein
VTRIAALCIKTIYEILGSHNAEDVDVGLLGCNALEMEVVCSSERWYLPTSSHIVTTQKLNIEKKFVYKPCYSPENSRCH